ncbi:PREDICTED: protein PLASTID MOVEMENT IMPAIRED 1-like [Tarenaya hassleriana]|uniref:protein PLASTID MOVEMENT IMPAIRED 1-like n=1 Tax=Tarenaya hassleriana TaxID=28532 RepID=UPI00053C1912|nr:PREDICTED: protein PLASTID MOVEMENT IMPAIRED 1-like [Tarenaya hassleriana]
MAGEYSGSRSSNTQLLAELEALSQTLYQKPQIPAGGNRRTASLALSRSSVPSVVSSADDVSTAQADNLAVSRPRSRRLSLSPWRSRSKLAEEEPEREVKVTRSSLFQNKSINKTEESAKEERRGIWNWKPIRGLYRIGMQKLSCLFSVEVVAAQNLPASMNGLRLGVCVRKKETKDGAVQTMPCRVSQGSADFEETLFIKCHVYYSPANGKGPAKFEARPFMIYLFAVDAKELEFGRNVVDLSELIQESVEKMNYEGARVRQWDISWDLSGKAKGGELVLKLGFQIMEKDGGAGIYSKSGDFGTRSPRIFSGSVARNQSKTSFSVPSPKLTSRSEAGGMEPVSDIQRIEHLNLDEPEEKQLQKTEEPKQGVEDDLPDFEVVDKGVEFDEDKETEKSDGTVGERSSEIKEIVNDPTHMLRLTELDSISKQIKALESMMKEDHIRVDGGEETETESQKLDEEEETVTKEFLQLLEDEETQELRLYQHKMEISEQIMDESVGSESENYLMDLGKGIGCVVQTRDGGYLVAMNPFDTVVSRKDPPKLVMQISKPIVVLLSDGESATGFELFHKMAGFGKELNSVISSLMPMDELMGKTAEQVAFEGIASAIIQGRNKELANTSAARTLAAVKTMANAMSNGRRERILTGIWNLDENPLSPEDVLAISLQKLEEMAIEGLRIQADMAEEEPPFDVAAAKTHESPLKSTVPLDEWLSNSSKDRRKLTLMARIQLRDPMRRYEAVGGPVVTVVKAVAEAADEERYKVGSVHVGAVKPPSEAAERRRLTAAQWLVAYGMGKKGKKQSVRKEEEEEMMWSLSSRVMADMWLKTIRNPDVRLQS